MNSARPERGVASDRMAGMKRPASATSGHEKEVPHCGVCGKQLVLRTNRKTQQKFYGCRQWKQNAGCKNSACPHPYNPKAAKRQAIIGSRPGAPAASPAQRVDNLLKVYFAGKITPCGGRDPGPDEQPRIVGGPEHLEDSSRMMERRDSYFLVGPLQISDDHRGGHGPATHGCGDSSCSVPRRAIVACCERQIGLCDLLIATIDKGVTCYGTLMEVGLAYSAGKVILIVFDGVRKDQRKELWFAAQMSLSSINSSNTAKAKAANAFEAVPYVKKRLGSLEQYLKQMQEVASGCKF